MLIYVPFVARGVRPFVHSGRLCADWETGCASVKIKEIHVGLRRKGGGHWGGGGEEGGRGKGVHKRVDLLKSFFYGPNLPQRLFSENYLPW